MNHLTLESSLTEYMLSFDRTESLFKAFKMDYGTKLRITEFAPGQVASVNNKSNSFLGTVYLQARYDIEDKLFCIFFVDICFYRSFFVEYKFGLRMNLNYIYLFLMEIY